MSEAVNNRAGERKAARFEAKAVKPDGSFEGYASLFGAEDLGRDVVMPGAFRKSLLKRGARKSARISAASSCAASSCPMSPAPARCWR